MVIYPYIFIKQKAEDKPPMALLVHELTHFIQVMRKGWLYFYFSYFVEYITNLFYLKSHWDAYYAISYEIEARKMEQIWRDWENQNPIDQESISLITDILELGLYHRSIWKQNV